MNNNNNNTTSTNVTKDDNIEDAAMQQFKFLVVIVMIILIAFLGLFIYNLIKCYLPKWRNKRQFSEDSHHHGTIEIEDI